MILVPREAEGFTMTPIPTMGGQETNELHLDGVRVPEEALLGTEGNGWIQLMAGLNVERIILAASALGIAQRAFDDALEYAKERKQFGRPVGLLPGPPAPLRRPRHRAGAGAPAGALGGPDDRRGPRPHASPGSVDGEAGGHRAGQALRAGRRAGGGRLRLRLRVPDGGPPSQRDRDHHLRRHLGDPEEHHRQDARASKAPGRWSRRGEWWVPPSPRRPLRTPKAFRTPLRRTPARPSRPCPGCWSTPSRARGPTPCAGTSPRRSAARSPSTARW